MTAAGISGNSYLVEQEHKHMPSIVDASNLEGERASNGYFVYKKIYEYNREVIEVAKVIK